MVGAGKIGCDDASFVIGTAEDDDWQGGAGGNGTDGHDDLRSFRKFQIEVDEQNAGNG